MFIRKVFALIVGCAVCMEMFLTDISFANDAVESFVMPENVIYADDNGDYHYIYTPLSEKWDEWSACDIDLKTQLPESLIKELSSQNLLNLFLENPAVYDIYLNDTYIAGYQSLKEHFTGCEELMARADYFDCLLDKYIEYEIPKERIIDYDWIFEQENYAEIYNEFISNKENVELIYEDFYVYATLDLLETMMVEYIGKGGQNCENAEKVFMSAYLEKNSQKEQSTYFKDINLDQMTKNILKTLAAPQFTTYNGSALDYIYNTNGDYDPPSSYSASLVKYHASLVSKALDTFNCHSFAWLQKRYPEQYQYIRLNNWTPFAKDGSYTRRRTVGEIQAGDIVAWTQHSGIVLQPSKENPNRKDASGRNVSEPYVMSKWGSGPIVAHFLTECLYSEGVRDNEYEYYYR